MRFFSLFLSFLLILSGFASCHAEQAPLETRLQAAFQRYDTLGASVAVFQNGSITYTYTYGLERIGGAEITSDTLFQVGSISKMVANIALMQLLEENSIPLDTELGDLLGYPVHHPDYPLSPVTLRQLMTHTASLRDSGDYESAISGSPKQLQNLFTDRAQFTFLEHEPGSKREYSNFGGGLIGSLIEILSGQSVDDYIRQNIFMPMDITAGYQAALLPEEAHIAAIYHMPERIIARDFRNDTAFVRVPDPETHYYFTAGKLIISAPDLTKVLIALCDGGVYQNTRLLKESTVQEMLTLQDYRGSVTCASGNGLFINIITDDVVDGRTLYGHGGKAYGMLCAAYFDPTDRTGVVMLTNGCQNRSVRNDVGMLSRLVTTLCYTQLIDPTHVVEDPFSVE